MLKVPIILLGLHDWGSDCCTMNMVCHQIAHKTISLSPPVCLVVPMHGVIWLKFTVYYITPQQQ